MTDQKKIQIPLTLFTKGGDWFLSLYFHPHLVPQRGMRVYPEKFRSDFISNIFITTNYNFILGFHPHLNLLPSRKKK
jgi:hypothetical protein